MLVKRTSGNESRLVPLATRHCLRYVANAAEHNVVIGYTRTVTLVILTAGARRQFAVGVAVSGVYVITATMGFRVAFAAEQVTTVWAPTGLAIAALLLGGRSLWPAIWIGAFTANAGTQAPLWTAAFVATGNTLEAVAASWLLSRFAGFDPAFSRTRDGLAFIVIAAGLSTMISATIGVGTLCAAQVQPWNRFGELWEAWWLGDALGALVVGPVILTSLRSRAVRSRRSRVETAAVVLGTLLVTEIFFAQALGPATGHHPIEYVIFPFLIIAAVRLGQPATSYVVLSAAAVAIWNTVRGSGPFAGSEVHQSLVLLQVFMGVVAGTGLLLAAAIAERETSERRRAAAHAVGEVLAEAPTLAVAAPEILRVVSEKLDWSTGTLWIVDEQVNQLRCVAVWPHLIPATSPFVTATKESLFARGIGLPGRVWASGKATWIENVVGDSNFPRAPVARDAGLHGAFGFPIYVGRDVHGVIEFFHHSIVSPDPALLETMSAVGRQIGQFVARHRVEAAVVEGQRQTRAILDSALDAVIGMDHRGTITDFNPAAERMFGYSQRQAIGYDLADLIIPSELRESHRQGLRHYLATGEGPFVDKRVETRAYHADGHEFPVEVSITRVLDQPVRFTGFVQDLTARVAAEREREELLLRELNARREAETANRAKDEFLATLSHELRTPLNAIIGWTHMLLDGTVEEQSRRRALEVIDRNAHLQAQLVGDILDVSKIITGGLKLDLRAVDLATVIGAALDAVRPAADAKKIRVNWRLAAKERVTAGDPQRLQQVIWNLLSNAVKFTPAGGAVEIELLDAEDEGVRIVVRDNGAGIDPAFLPHVFDRFTQADGSISRQHGGLGIGLAIVRHLVELHGGCVRATSDGAGTGSTFVVDLPRPEAAAWPAAEPGHKPVMEQRPGEPLPLSGCRALVVDDDGDARDLLAAVLVAAGADVRTAASVGEAVKRLDDARPGILLADIGMPGEDGYHLIRQVRARDAASGQRLPAVAITAYASSRDRARALLEGFDSHISKPISPAEIVNAVRSLCAAAADRG